MADTHTGKRLSRQQGFLHQADSLGHIALEGIIFARMNPDGPVGIPACDAGDDLPDHRFQLCNVIDFLAHEIAAHHIGIFADHLQGLNCLRQIVAGGDIVLDQGQGNPADGRQEADIHARLLLHQWQDAVNLPEHPGGGGILLHQGGVADLHILDMPLFVFPADPQEGIFVQCQPGELIPLGILQHPLQIMADVLILDPAEVRQVDLIIGGHALGEHIAVQVQLFQVGEHCLGFLQNGQRPSDAVDVLRGMGQVQQDQVCEVDEGIVIDLPLPVFSRQTGQIQPLLHFPALFLQKALLGIGKCQTQLFDVIKRIADLVLDGQGDEDIRTEIGVAVGMEVCGEFHFLPDIGLDQCLPEGKLVVLGLAHEGFCDGGDHGIDLNLAVRVDVRQLGSVQPENIDPLTVALDVAGNPARDDGSAIPEGGLLPGDSRQIVDQIVRLMVDGMDGIRQHRTVHAQSHHDILFLVQIEFSKVAHIITHCSRFFCFYCNTKPEKRQRQKSPLSEIWKNIFPYILFFRSSIFSSIRRMVSRNAPSSFPLGSSSPQSSRWEQGRKGQFTLHPMVTTTSTWGI